MITLLIALALMGLGLGFFLAGLAFAGLRAICAGTVLTLGGGILLSMSSVVTGA